MMDSIRLVPLNEEEELEFVRTTTSCYSKNYDEVDETMAKHILECNKNRYDSYGYMTIRKEVFSATMGGEKIGFTTLTFKRGGCVKTGPTILYPKYRGRQLGPLLQNVLQEKAKSMGARKTYGTVSTANPRAIIYMIRSNYRIEAHLKQHYNPIWDEIVFGKYLNESGKDIQKLISTIHPQILSKKYKLKKSRFSDYNNEKHGIKRMIESDLVSPDDNMVIHIYQATEICMEDKHMKPKRLFTIWDGESVVGGIIIIPKRGGTLKLNIIGVVPSEYISMAVIQTMKESHERVFRKASLFIPEHWDKIYYDLRLRGWFNEGTLLSPYRDQLNFRIISCMVKNII